MTSRARHCLPRCCSRREAPVLPRYSRRAATLLPCDGRCATALFHVRWHGRRSTGHGNSMRQRDKE
ncbi:hypothetical protein HAX54_035528, partial [Datura stramonium]|nr:hypothetical protein [Datura stramonium]